MVVDSDPAHAQIALKVLSGCAEEVSLLTSGSEAIMHLTDDAAKTSLPILVVLHLEESRAQVVEILKKMRVERATENIPFLILTGTLEEKEFLEQFEAKLCSCVIKPLTFGKLVYALPALGMTINDSVIYSKAESTETSLAYH
ncbi:MAG: hypothetical protein ABIQ35_13455 [Verrucomicrobiota bacterium]